MPKPDHRPDRPQVPVRHGRPVVIPVYPDREADDNPELVALFTLVWPSLRGQLQ